MKIEHKLHVSALFPTMKIQIKSDSADLTALNVLEKLRPLKSEGDIF